MRRAKSVASLHSPNGSVNGSPNGFTPRYDGATSMTSDLKAPKVVLRTVDRQTQTTVDRYTQTPVVLAGNEYNTYYHQLLSSINSRSSSADFAVVNRPGEVRQLQSFVQKHGPAMFVFVLRTDLLNCGTRFFARCIWPLWASSLSIFYPDVTGVG